MSSSPTYTRQAADAVRRCMDWKYALSLELTDAGFDFTLLHDFRERLLADDAAQRLLDTLLTACKARGWIKARGSQRTDSTHVLAAVRSLHRLECVLETMHLALNRLSAADPDWLRARVPLDWYDRYGQRAEHFRLPKEASKRQALAETIGVDGYELMGWLFAADTPPHLRALPAVEVLRRIWIQQYYRRIAPGADEIRWRATDEEPPSALLIGSPYDTEARYSSKRDTRWVGYKVHVSETCDPDRPRLITQVATTLATDQDSTMGPDLGAGLGRAGPSTRRPSPQMPAMLMPSCWSLPVLDTPSTWSAPRSGPTVARPRQGRDTGSGSSKSTGRRSRRAVRRGTRA